MKNSLNNKGGGVTMAKAKKGMEMYGHWIFLLGVAIAIIAGIVAPANMTVVWILAVLGIIVGLLNISLREEVPFLVAALVLIVAANSLAVLPFIGEWLGKILNYVVAFVAPAAVIVALKEIYAFAKKG
jgi:hypothetical protein